MAISTPQLISCSARVDDVEVISAGELGAFVYVFKNIIGVPLLEPETFTIADAQAALSGPHGFNIDPTRVEILDQGFQLVTAILLTDVADVDAGADPIVRFYWNLGAGRALDTILYLDYNIVTRETVGPVQQTPFGGIDPYVLDGRTDSDPERLFMLVVTTDGDLTIKISHDLGRTWGRNCTSCCLFEHDVFYVEGLTLDATSTRERIRAVLREVSPSTADVYLVDLNMTPVRVARSKKLYPYFRRPVRDDGTGRDEHRFKSMYPLVRRGKEPTEDPC